MADYSTGKFNSMPPQPRLGFVEPQSGEGVTAAPGDASLAADRTVPPDNMTDVGNSALRTSPSARAVHARVSQLYVAASISVQRGWYRVTRSTTGIASTGRGISLMRSLSVLSKSAAG